MNRRELLKGIGTLGMAAALPLEFRLSPPIEHTMQSLASKKNIGFGTSVGNEIYRNSIYRSHILRHCSIITPENSLKWKNLVGSKKNYDFHDSDRLYDFCFENNLEMRGHALIFEKSMKKWISDCDCNLNTELTRFIHTVTARYPNIQSWDVFNEIIDSNGNMGWLREDSIFRVLGPKYLKNFSELLYTVNPSYEQVVNDWIGPYSGKYFDRRRYSALKMLEYFKKNDLKVKTLGVQSHLLFSRENYDRKAWLSFCKECKNLGFNIKISEIDLSLGKRETNFRAIEDIAYSVRTYLEDTLSFGNVNSLVAWGLVDSFSFSLSNDMWRNVSFGPSPFTSDYNIGLIGKEIKTALLNAPRFESQS